MNPASRHARILFSLLSLLVASAQAANDADAQFSGKQIAPTASSLNATIPTLVGGFNTSAVASFDPRSKNFLRLESAWSTQFDDSTRSVRIGDSISDPGSWGSAVRYAGVQFGTNFNLRSDLLSSDRLALSGVSILPSASDALFARVPDAKLEQRGLALNGKAVVAGANNLSFTTRDASGKTATFTRPLIAKKESAQAGCKQFSMGVGRVRKDYALVSDNYGSLFANSTVVCGTDDGYTIEAHGEYLSGDAGLAGIDVSRAVGNLGTASVAMAASHKEDDAGWALRAGLQRSSDRFELNLRARLQSPEFREIGSADEAVVSRVLASVGAKLSDRNTIALAYANQTMLTAQRIDIVSLAQTINLGSSGSRGKLSIVADRAVHDDTNSSVKVSYVRSLRQ